MSSLLSSLPVALFIISPSPKSLFVLQYRVDGLLMYVCGGVDAKEFVIVIKELVKREKARRKHHR